MSPHHAATVGAAGLGANLSIILVWLVQTFMHVAVPDQVALAIGGVLTAACGFVTHEYIASRARREAQEQRLLEARKEPPGAVDA